MTGSRVSIVLPVHDAARHLPEALAGLRGLVWDDLELVAVDDGSTDGSAAILAAEAGAWGGRMRILTQANRGAGAARNAGIAAATGDFVLLADADDRCDPQLVAAGMAALAAAPDADLAVARCRYIDADGQVVAVQGPLPPRIGARDLLRGVMVNTPLVRRAAGEAIGWHDETLRGSIDLDLFVRLTLRRPDGIASVAQVLSDYRRSTGQITSDWRRMQQSWVRVRDRAVAAGLEVSAAEMRAMWGHHCIYWATLAYVAGDYASARRLMLSAAWRVPGHVLRDDLARVRAGACLASLLPAPLHARIRDKFNAGREARS